MADNDRKLALALVTELEKALAAIRSGDIDGISYAEVQVTALSLLEDSQHIHELLRATFRKLDDSPSQAQFERLADSDYELACVISDFIAVIFDLANPRPDYRSKKLATP